MYVHHYHDSSFFIKNINKYGININYRSDENILSEWLYHRYRY